jgi:hypothetical protein
MKWNPKSMSKINANDSKAEIEAQLGAAEGTPKYDESKPSLLSLGADDIKAFAQSAGKKIKNRFAK